MPFSKSKRSLAAEARTGRKLPYNCTISALIPPEAPGGKSDPQLLVEGPKDGSSSPLELMFEIDVKQESIPQFEVEGQFFKQDELEVKEEPDIVDSRDSEQDPIGQSNEENEPDDGRCQFCFKLFQESSGRGFISNMQVEFVLGLSKWGTPGKGPDCCEECRKMFDMFYKFKQDCLVALARPAEFFVWTGNKRSEKFADVKPTNSTKPTSAQGGNIRNSKPMEDCHTLEESFKPESAEAEVFYSEPRSIEVQQDIGQAECVTLSKKASDGKDLEPHLTAEANESSTEANKLVEVEKMYCFRCQQWFPNEEVYLQHTRSCIVIRKRKKRPPKSDGTNLGTNSSKHTNESSSKDDEPVEVEKASCPRCRKWFPNEEIFLQHAPNCDGPLKRKQPPLKIACPLCPKKFAYKKELGYHTDMHNGVRTIPCRVEGCTKMFYHPIIRHNHEKICSQQTKTVCNVCGAILRSVTSLRYHMASHGDPQFICDICNKAFYTKVTLKKHGSVHTDERRFECKVCGKRFKSREANRVHQRIHTDETPYACHICGQRFRYNCLLKTHLEKGHDPPQGLAEEA